MQVGQRLGPYEILALEGAGGMGEVYRARDIKLNREIAIKVLPERVAGRRESLVRLLREAQILASLNHPNIATIYGVEEHDGALALMLELVDGPTLADRIAQGPLSLSEALVVARQIATALDAAHEKGIIHRDLKPSNVKLRPDGAVKVLDFGLAKALEQPHEGADVQAPTITASVEGVLGTVAYMSPEQARGQQVDKRTDIWAFGCVLFEMLSGGKAFDRNTSSDTIAAVLEREPDWAKLPTDLPPAVRALLSRCLQKDRAQRMRDIGDALFELDTASSAPLQADGASRSGFRKASTWGLALLATAVTGTALFAPVVFRPSPPSAPPIDFRIALPPNYTPSGGVAVSPDGRHVALGAFGAGPGIWVHTLATAEFHPLPGTEAPAMPFWKPDGSAVGFFTRGRLHRIDPVSSAMSALADAPNPAGGSWSTKGTVIFSAEGVLYTVAETGGGATRVPMPQTNEPVIRSRPYFLPDDRHFLYHELGRTEGAIYVGSLTEPRAIRLVESADPAVYSSGFLLFVRGSALMAQRFSLEKLALEGPAEPVSPDVAPRFLSARAEFSAPVNARTLAFVSPLEGQPGTLTWFDRSGQPDRQLQASPDTEYLNPAISPDGTRVAGNLFDPLTGNWDVWVVDVAREITSRLTFGPSQDADPVWSRDGKEIVFASTRNGRPGLYRTSAEGVVGEERLFELDDAGAVIVPSDWTPDGRFIVFTQTHDFPGGWQIWVLPLTGDRKPFRLFAQNAFMHFAGRVSPDGRWIAYQSAESGTFEVFVQPFMAAGQRTQISQGGGVHPRWKSDGRELMFWAYPVGGIASAALEFSGDTFRAAAPRSLFPIPPLTLTDGRPHYDVTRDGKRFLLRQPNRLRRGAEIRVIANWVERLR